MACVVGDNSIGVIDNALGVVLMDSGLKAMEDWEKTNYLLKVGTLRKCPVCRGINRKDTRRCPNCGTWLTI